MIDLITIDILLQIIHNLSDYYQYIITITCKQLYNNNSEHFKKIYFNNTNNYLFIYKPFQQLYIIEDIFNNYIDTNIKFINSIGYYGYNYNNEYKFTNSIAYYGLLDILIWAYKKYPINYSLYTNAAKGGHLNILKWAVLTFHDTPDFNTICDTAAEHGHLHIIQWAAKNKGSYNDITFLRAVENGHTNIIEWLYEHGCQWNETICIRACQCGHLNILQWAYNNGCKIYKSQCKKKVHRKHRIAIIEWLESI
tara:strand:- start:12220 stop:12975 length:756 start_codon:yes stop_codon:yes gene_type:complete